LPHDPVVIVHGYLAPKWFMLPLRERIRKQGFDAHLVDLTPLALRDVRVLARQLGDNVDRILGQTGAETVSLLGVSLGGFVALQYVRNGGADKVRRIVAVGAPFQGTWFALLGLPMFGAWSAPVWQTLPTSRYLAALRDGGSPVPLFTVSIPGDVVAPPERCRLDGAEEVVLEPTRFPAAHQWLGLSGDVALRLGEVLARDL
jgi:pimeloyl-ACP methyl ester carboxylesterase